MQGRQAYHTRLAVGGAEGVQLLVLTAMQWFVRKAGRRNVVGSGDACKKELRGPVFGWPHFVDLDRAFPPSLTPSSGAW